MWSYSQGQGGVSGTSNAQDVITEVLFRTVGTSSSGGVTDITYKLTLTIGHIAWIISQYNAVGRGTLYGTDGPKFLGGLTGDNIVAIN